ncbi:hypothetical protein FHETE_1370 [Fusarium heterosporum]|uniref:Uncharacterized protein n=1 Tax=Fusarium heterosporum TaxID=42747 RepID=A0A8H5X0U7_FUSHE|nr:hypothetical protein FHETE_1370 [Fusarium heterosporum]
MPPASKVKVRLSIDLGSSAVKAAYNIDIDDKAREVRFWRNGVVVRDDMGIDNSARRSYLRNKVYFCDDGRMDIGETNDYPSHSGLKRALSPILFPDGEAERLRQALKDRGKSAVDALCLAYKKALEAFERSITDDYSHSGKPDYEFEAITLSIPEIYAQGDENSAAVQATYLEAAKGAGFPIAQVRFETEAMATAVYLTKTFSQSTSPFTLGPKTKFHFVDMGEMTWDAITISIADGKLVQDRPPQGGSGGMGDVWAELQTDFPDKDYGGNYGESFTFRTMRYNICSMVEPSDVVCGQSKLPKERLLTMLMKTWRHFFERMEIWLQSEDQQELHIVGGAPSSSKFIQSFLKHQLQHRGIEAIFPPHDDPTTASEIGFVVSYQGKTHQLRELVIPLKEAKMELKSITRVFQDILSEQGEIQLWVYYSESGKATGKKFKTTYQALDGVWEFQPNEATLLDPVKIRIGEESSETVHFRFIQDTEDQRKLYLEVYSNSEYRFTPLRITRDRTRILLEQEEGDLALTQDPETTTQIAEKLFDQVVITSGKGSAILREDGLSRMARLNLEPKTQLQLRVPTPDLVRKGLLSVKDGGMWQSCRVNDALKARFPMLKKWRQSTKDKSLGRTCMDKWEKLLYGIDFKDDRKNKKKRANSCSGTAEQRIGKRLKQALHAETHGNVASTQNTHVSPECGENISRPQQNSGGGDIQLNEPATTAEDHTNMDPHPSSPVEHPDLAPSEGLGATIDDIISNAARDTLETLPNQNCSISLQRAVGLRLTPPVEDSCLQDISLPEDQTRSEQVFSMERGGSITISFREI